MRTSSTKDDEAEEDVRKKSKVCVNAVTSLEHAAATVYLVRAARGT